MNRKEDIDARIETLQKELEELKKHREWIEKPITERIKTFDDAVEELGIEHPLVKQYMAAANGNEPFSRNTIAYMKLLIIAAALNEGWEPQFTTGEYRYYPWFYLYKQEEIDKMDEEKKKSLWLFGGSANHGASCGLACVFSLTAWSHAHSGISARIAVKTEELAHYFGKQFIDIWAEYLFDGCEIEKHDTDV